MKIQVLLRKQQKAKFFNNQGRRMYRPALVVKTFLNKWNECGHVFGIFSGLLPGA